MAVVGLFGFLGWGLCVELARVVLIESSAV